MHRRRPSCRSRAGAKRWSTSIFIYKKRRTDKAAFGSPRSGMNIKISYNTSKGEVKTLQWVGGSESTWFGRILRHCRRKAVFCVKNEQRQRANSKKKRKAGIFECVCARAQPIIRSLCTVQAVWTQMLPRAFIVSKDT
jgi:hypothetical protein